MHQPAGLNLEGITAIVTGANRGLGRAFAHELLRRGASTVYAGARDPKRIVVTDARLVPLKLDITNADDIRLAAERCGDVSVLINNAGVMLRSPFLSAPDMGSARIEMETNYFGTLAMSRAFAPLLAARGGGALVNVLSVASWCASPFNGSYCAAKSAEWALSNALRVELRAQGTLVVGVHAGWIDTDMAATVDEQKISARDVAAQTLDAVQHGREEVLTDDSARHIKESLPVDQSTLYPDIQKRWDANETPWKD